MKYRNFYLKLKVLFFYLFCLAITLHADWIQHETFGTGGARGLAWGDYNNDGYEDLAIVSKSSTFPLYYKVCLYENEGSDEEGNFNFLKVQEIGPEDFSANGVTWADIDNDGDLDLTIVGKSESVGHNGKPVLIYKNNGPPEFFNETEVIKLGGDNSEVSQSAAWEDYDNDGYIDLVVANSSGPSRLFRNEGDGTFEEIKQFATEANGVAWWDVNNDGRADFALATKNGVYLCQQVRQTFPSQRYTFDSHKIQGMENYESNGVAWFETKSNYDGTKAARSYLIVTGKPLPLSKDSNAKIVIYDFDGNYLNTVNHHKVNTLNEENEAWDVALFCVKKNSEWVWNSLITFGTSIGWYTFDGEKYFEEQAKYDAQAFAVSIADYDNDGDVDFATNNDLGQKNSLFENNNYWFSPPPTIRFVGLREDRGNGWSNQDALGTMIFTGSESDDNSRQCIGSISSGIGWSSSNSQKLCPQSWGTFTFKFPCGKTVDGGWLLKKKKYYISECHDVSVYEDGKIEAECPGFIGQFHLSGDFVRWADYNRDGFPDLAAYESNLAGDELIRFYKNDLTESGTFIPEDFRIFMPYNRVSDLCWGDFDNDGDLDLAAAAFQNNKLFVNRLSETSRVQFEEYDFFGNGGGQLQWADLDNDGDLDLIVRYRDNTLKWFENLWSKESLPDLEERFKEHLIPKKLSVTDRARLSVIDYDGDGAIDILAPFGLIHNEYPSFSTQYKFLPNGIQPEWYDYNNDGNIDVLWIDVERENAFLSKNSGQSNPQFEETEYSFDFYGNSWGDCNLDGAPDVFCNNGLMFNSGPPTFGFEEYKPYRYMTGQEIYLADMDRDGDLDFWSGEVIYKNTRIDRGSIVIKTEGLSYEFGSDYSNRDGLGAKVKLFRAGTRRLVGYQEVGSGKSGTIGEVLFGAPAVDQDMNPIRYDVEVTFPSGIVVDKSVNWALGNIDPTSRAGMPILVREVSPRPGIGHSEENVNTSLVGRWARGPCYAVDALNNMIYYGDGAIFCITDFSNPTNPRQLGKLIMPSVVINISVNSHYAFVGCRGGGLYVVDISESNNPEIISFIPSLSGVAASAINGEYLYLACGEEGLGIFDISSIESPELVGFLSSEGRATDIAINGQYAYLADGSAGLKVIDISSPSSPRQVGSVDVYAGRVAVNGQYAYLASLGHLRIIDVTVASSPWEVGDFNTLGSITDVQVDDSHAYLAKDRNSLDIIDITDVSSPEEIGSCNTLEFVYRLVVNGSYAYLPSRSKGLYVIDISTPTSPRQVSLFPTASSAQKVIVRDNYAYVADYFAGLRVLDVSNPANQIEIGAFPLNEQQRAVAIDVNGNYAYLAIRNGLDFEKVGLQILDITIKSNPIEVAFYKSTEVDVSDVAINDNYAFLCTRYAVYIIDISDPYHPREVNTIICDGAASGITVCENKLYICDLFGLRIVDISDVYAPTTLGEYSTSGYFSDVCVLDNLAYVADREAGLHIIDVSTPTEPEEIGFLETEGCTFDVSVNGNFAYVAESSSNPKRCWNYGVQIVDISDPASPQKVGYFKTGDQAIGVFADKDLVYVADSEDGVYAVHNNISTDIYSKDRHGIPLKFQLYHNYPNPFNPATTIAFDVPKDCKVTIDIYNILGQHVVNIIDSKFKAGSHKVTFDAGKLPSGLYFYRMKADGFRSIKKMIILK